MSDKHIKLYWWTKRNGLPNLGDELGPILLGSLFNLEIEHASLQEYDAISVGSILGFAFRPEVWHQDRNRLHVLGAGFMHSTKKTAISGLHIHFVRGYLSAMNLSADKDQELPVGDLGLLTACLYGLPRLTTRAIGIIPHHSRSDCPMIESFLNGNSDACLISMVTRDLKSTVNKMLSCDVIVSQSLHGLIIADSLGVPNTWLRSDTLGAGSYFKFFDYFSSIGRDPSLHISTLDNPAVRANIYQNRFFLSDTSRQNAIKRIYDCMERFIDMI
jgi:pyruvyltransferase